jgi:hypothetical protein
MSEIDHAATAQLVADWVRGEPDDTRQMRRTRLLAYHRVWQHPYQLGMFLTQVAFDRAMAGAAPGAGPREWQQLTRRGGDGWQRRGILGHQVLDLLRGVDFTTDRVAAVRAKETAAALLAKMAEDSGDPELRAVDWNEDWGDPGDWGPA